MDHDQIFPFLRESETQPVDHEQTLLTESMRTTALLPNLTRAAWEHT